MSLLLPTRHILLADDDKDDRLLFHEVLEEFPLRTILTAVNNGEQLMQRLNDEKEQQPDILFLDLNMPRKNGFDCLLEIKQSQKLKKLPVIIFTTSYEPEIVNLLYKNGAQYYIRKPNNFEQLKKVIHLVLIHSEKRTISKVPRDKFVLLGEPVKDENR